MNVKMKTNETAARLKSNYKTCSLDIVFAVVFFVVDDI